MRSAEMELASASSPSAARSVISRIAGVAPSVESLAQGSTRRSILAPAGRMEAITGIFHSVFKRSGESTPKSTDADNDLVSDNTQANSDSSGWGSKLFGISKDKNKSKKDANQDKIIASRMNNKKQKAAKGELAYKSNSKVT